MGRSAIFVVVLGALVAVIAATSRSDAQQSGDEPDLTGMPTSEPATDPAAAEPQWEPFTPYEVGPPEHVWAAEHQSAADRAIVARIAGEAAQRQRFNDIYAAAAAEQFTEGVAQLAAHRLGLTDLADLGVIGSASGDAPGGETGGDGGGL